MSTSIRRFTALVLLLVMAVYIAAPADISAQTNTTTLESFIKSLSLEQLKAKAENGDVRAQHALGFRYYRGDGVAKDFAAAAEWYRKAAEQGFAPAESELGSLYGRGQGVEKSDVEAVKWLRKAAEQGESGAQV